MCAPDQICGLLWEVPAAAHALPVLTRVHVPLQLQSPERRRLGGREQRARLPPAEGASGIARHGGNLPPFDRAQPFFFLSLCSAFIQMRPWLSDFASHRRTFSSTIYTHTFVQFNLMEFRPLNFFHILL